MNINYIFLKKSFVFIVGLFIMATGVSLSVIGNLGVSPISSIPFVYSLKYPLTIGEITIIFNLLLIILQVIILRKRFHIFQLIQFPIVFLFGFFIDFTLYLISWLEPTHYFSQMFYCLLGCLVLAIGVFLEIEARLTFLPGEGFIMAIVKTFNLDFGKTKVAVDSFFVLTGIISSFVFWGGLKGIREGTVAAAILVGYTVKFLSHKCKFFEKWLQPEKEAIPD